MRPLLDAIAQYGVPRSMSYSVLEFTANLALFVPAGFLFAAIATRRVRPWVPIIGVVLSVAAELTQYAFLPGRTADPRDVVSNSLGFAAGWLVVVVVSRIRHGLYQRRERHRHRQAVAAATLDQSVSTPVLSSTMIAPPSSTL